MRILRPNRDETNRSFTLRKEQLRAYESEKLKSIFVPNIYQHNKEFREMCNSTYLYYVQDIHVYKWV